MLGKTHLAVGIAASFAVLQPTSLPELMVGLGAAAVGALISDIDVDTSSSHNDADVITTMTVISVVLVIVLDKLFDIGVYRILREKSNLGRVIAGALLFVGVCAYGKETPHRSFMHSILALVILFGLVGLILPMAAPYFAVAFLSHLAIDMLNTKHVRLLYPLPGGFCLGLCHANGMVNGLLFLAGCVVAVAEVGQNLLRLSGGIKIF